MDRDVKHALFTAAALNAMVLAAELKDFQDRDTAQGIASDAMCYADAMLIELELKP